MAVLGLSASVFVPAQESRQQHPPFDPDTRRAAATQSGPSGIIDTVAGNGDEGIGGYGGTASPEMVNPVATVFDNASNMYIADRGGQNVLKWADATGEWSVYAGVGQGGYSGDKGPATKAMLNEPSGLAIDAEGDLLIADSRNNVIRKVTAKTGIITTIAGNGEGAGGDASPEQCYLRIDGVKATASPLCSPSGVAVGPTGSIYIADTLNSVIRLVEPANGIISTVAGNGVYAYAGDEGPAIDASLAYPLGVAVDKAGNLYITDTNNCTIREVKASTKAITSLVGSAGPYNEAFCDYIGDGGPATQARIDNPGGVVVSSAGDIFIADTGNSVIRLIAGSNIYTVAGSFYPNPGGGALSPITGYTGDGGPATYATLYYPQDVALDKAGNLYIADSTNHVVREVTYPAALPTTAPVITPASTQAQYVTTPATVTIAAMKGAATYYTTDGSIPTTHSTKYTKPIQLTDTASITAISTVPGSLNSPASIANYFNAPSPSFSPAQETITKPTKVTITDANSKAQIYYTMKGANPTVGQWSLYTGPITVPVDTYLEAAVWVAVDDAKGNVVGVFGSIEGAQYANPAKPLVTTKPATLINGKYATLNAAITPNSPSSEYWFAFGTNSSSLTTTSIIFGLSGTATVPVRFNLNSLQPNTKYYFQAVAGDLTGTTKGAILSFITAAN
jgi:sugar lactone lactonase YvrE